MKSQIWLKLIQRHRAIAVIRTSQLELGIKMAQAVAHGGMRLIEITWNSDRPTIAIETLRIALPDCCIGAGTLLTAAQMQEAIAAGAEFLFTPHFSMALVQRAIAQDIAIIPGALTPTEIVTAWQAGAASVKVFPIQSIGGAKYIQSLQDPLGSIPLIPTGGITPANAKDFLDAGAIGVGLSGHLFPKTAIAQGRWELVTEHARQMMAAVRT